MKAQISQVSWDESAEACSGMVINAKTKISAIKSAETDFSIDFFQCGSIMIILLRLEADPIPFS